MAFNWFRRQHSDSSTTPSQQPGEPPLVKEQPQPEPTATSTPTDQTTQADASAQDLLAFAKAAYKNIQQKQQLELAQTPASEQVPQTPPEATPASEQVPQTTLEATPASEQVPQTPPEATSASEQVPETTPEEASVTVTATEELESTAEESSVSEVVAIAEQPDTPSLVSNESELQPQPTELSPTKENEEEKPAASLSFLERAAAERQAKQERLLASIVEVPEPEVPQPVVATATTTTEVVEEIPGLAFDEGFLWSTEILAAQGRRPEDISPEEITWLKKLRQGLDKTRRNVVNQLKAIVGQGPLNQAAVEEIESVLLQADVGVEATDYI